MKFMWLKNIVLLCIMVGLTIPVTCQLEWYKKDEIYLYEVRRGFEFEKDGILSMTYYKDTVLNGHQLKVLRFTNETGENSDIFIRQEGEKVSYYWSSSNEFNLMYDFSTKSGDPAPVSGYIIESTDTIVVHNIKRKTQIWQRNNLRILVIEGIGMIGDPEFGNLFICSPPIPLYRCFSSLFNGWDYYFRCFGKENEYFDPFGECCEGLTQKDVCIHVIPNPASESFRIKSNQFFDNYTIYDPTGKMVFKKALTRTYSDACNINLPSSLYFVVVRYGTSLLSTKKLYIQSGR